MVLKANYPRANAQKLVQSHTWQVVVGIEKRAKLFSLDMQPETDWCRHTHVHIIKMIDKDKTSTTPKETFSHPHYSAKKSIHYKYYIVLKLELYIFLEHHLHCLFQISQHLLLSSNHLWHMINGRLGNNNETLYLRLARIYFSHYLLRTIAKYTCQIKC